MRAGGAPRRRRGEGRGQPGGSDPGQRGAVAGAAQGGQDGRVDQAACAPRGPQPGAHRAAQQCRRGDRGASIAIERAQLALGTKARQASIEGRQPLARVVEAGAVGRQQAHVGPHAAEGQLVLGHEVLVTRGAGAGAGSGRGRGRGRSGPLRDPDHRARRRGRACGLGVADLVDDDPLDDHAAHEHAAGRRGRHRGMPRAQGRIATDAHLPDEQREHHDERGQRPSADGEQAGAARAARRPTLSHRRRPRARARARRRPRRWRSSACAAGAPSRGATATTTGCARAGSTTGAGGARAARRA